jgi:hypothetical protein
MTSSTRRGWGVSITPRLLFIPRKDPVPIVQEAGWAPGPVWAGAENLAPTGIRSPDRPACSQSLYRLRYLAHQMTYELQILYFHTTYLHIWQTVVLFLYTSFLQFSLQLTTESESNKLTSGGKKTLFKNTMRLAKTTLLIHTTHYQSSIPVAHTFTGGSKWVMTT